MNDTNSMKVLLERLNSMYIGLVEQLPNLAVGLLILGVTAVAAAIASRVVMKVLGSSGLRKSLAVFFRKVSTTIIWVLGIVIAATVVFPSVTPGRMLSALGLGSVAIGFAFKDVFENFIAGMLILLREPFQLGDFIECEDAEGFVDEITIRDTRLRCSDGQNIVLPNAMLFKNPVTVRTSGKLRRVDVTCGVAYDEDIANSRDVIRKAVSGVATVNGDKPVQVFAKEFGASSVDFQVTWWTDSAPVDVRRSRDQVIEAVKGALDEAGIEIPFPYRTLTFKEELNICNRSARETDSEAA